MSETQPGNFSRSKQRRSGHRRMVALLCVVSVSCCLVASRAHGRRLSEERSTRDAVEPQATLQPSAEAFQIWYVLFLLGYWHALMHFLGQFDSAPSLLYAAAFMCCAAWPNLQASSADAWALATLTVATALAWSAVVVTDNALHRQKRPLHALLMHLPLDTLASWLALASSISWSAVVAPLSSSSSSSPRIWPLPVTLVIVAFVGGRLARPGLVLPLLWTCLWFR